MYLNRILLHHAYYPTSRYYPFNVPALRHTAALQLKSQVVFFVGENGSGKSTLLEAVAKKCGIHVWDQPKRHTAHQNPYEGRLVDFIDVVWEGQPVAGSLFKAETFHDLADFLDDVALCDPGRLEYHGGRILNTLSHGEGMLSYFSGRYHVKGLYFLDEPEAALSPASQLRFLQILQQLMRAGHAQFIIATHSPILMSLPGAQILNFNSKTIQEVAYEETDHYRIYRQFFNRHVANGVDSLECPTVLEGVQPVLA
jgi:predicted ATPase